jgi:hypothetical protein
MRAALVLVVLAACGSPAAAPHDRAATRTTAAASWKALDPHGDDWEAKVATIPEGKREEMAIALLRQGNFNCPTVTLQEGCESVTQFLGVGPSDGLESPCLRRKLVRWAVDQVPAKALVIHRKLVLELIISGGVEPELSVAIFEKVLPEADEALRVKMIMAIERIREDLADAAVTDLSNESLWTLACQDVDAAALALVESGAANSWEHHQDCTRDTRFRRETSVQLVEHERDSGESYRYSPFKMIEWNDCTVMSLVVKEHGASRGALWPRQMCIGLLHKEDIRDLIAPGALTVKHDTDDVNDDRNDRRYTERVQNDDDFELPFAEELLLAFPECRGRDQCQVPGTRITFKFTYDEMNRLTEIERDETIGGCD